MSIFVEALENRSLMSASMATDSMMSAEPVMIVSAKVAKPAKAIPNLVGTYRGMYVKNSFFELNFKSQTAKGVIHGTIFGLAFAAVPNSATLTVPITASVDAAGKFTATAKGSVKNAGLLVTFSYDFTGTASADGKTIKAGKLAITAKFKGHGGTAHLPFSAVKTL